MPEGYKNQEDLRKKARSDFFNFMIKKEVTAEDTRYIMEKVSEGNYSDDNEKINQVLEFVRKKEKDGLLLQDIGRFLTDTELVENLHKDIEKKIQDVGFKEKDFKILKSLCDKERDGEVCFYTKNDTEPFVCGKTNDLTQKQVVVQISDILTFIKKNNLENQVEISFEEI